MRTLRQPEEESEIPLTGWSRFFATVFYLPLNALTGTLESLFFLMPLAFIFDLVGYAPPFARLFFVYGLLALPLCRCAKGIVKGASVLVFVMLINAIVSLPQPAELCVLVFAHIWIWSVVGLATRPLIQGIFFYLFLYLYLFSAPVGYQVLESITGMAALVNSWMIGSTFDIGYTYQNLGSLLLFLCLSIHAWEPGLLSKLRTGAFFLVALLVNGLMTSVLLFKMNLDPDLVWELKFRDVFTYAELAQHLKSLVLLNFPALVFLAHAIVYLFLHHDVQSPVSCKDEQTPEKFRWLSSQSISFLGIALFLLVVAIPSTSFRSSTTSRLLFLERGVVSFTKPDYTRFGRGASGMYGFFSDYARLFGCEAEVVSEIPTSLDPTQILVITNLDEPMTSDEMERIWDFVRIGGKMWVLGDHTFIKNGRNHINDLLEPCHISLHHDSAQFFPQGWFHSYRMRQGTAFSTLSGQAENRLSILVGASLELAPPARPLIMGRFAYGDWGVTSPNDNRGYIGDFEYQATERLGDLALVAGEQVGKGRVLVFGDTTSFFNNNLSRSYELLRSALTWFGEPARYGWFAGRIAGLIVGFAMIGLLLASLVARQVPAPMLLIPLAMVSFAVHRPGGLLPFDTDVARDRMAVIDFSHHPYASKHSSMDNGLYGLSINFLRYGMLPVTQNHWDSKMLDHANLLFLNAPRRPFSAQHVQDIRTFMERGGTVLLACGAQHYENCRTLLDPVQLRIRNVPLGRFFDRSAFGQPIQYFSAWPIEVAHPDASVLSMYNDWPLIVDVPVGAGHFILVADSEFFHNRNLESLERYAIQNIEFVRNLLDYVKEEHPSQ